MQRSSRICRDYKLQVRFWMDSQTVLTWIRTCSRKFKPFVSVRVAEIQETLETQAFRYIRSDCNPADVLTKGTPPEELKSWMEGLPFLRLPEDEWPKFEENAKQNDEESSNEMKPNEVKASKPEKPAVCAAATKESADIRQPTENPIMEHLMKTCSTYTKARKTLAYVLRFINNTRTKKSNKSPISPQELRESELQMLKWCQQTINIDTVDKKLIPTSDEQGLWNEMRKPIILPRGHQMVNLLLKPLHEKRAHSGYKSRVYESRKRFWIVGVRKMAQEVTSKCVTCKKLRRRPLEQLMGQIPKLLVAAGFPAFNNRAIDMFGPFQVRIGRDT